RAIQIDTPAGSNNGNGSQVTVNSGRSEEHTSELQSRQYLVCRLLLEKKNSLRKHRELPVGVCLPVTHPAVDYQALRTAGAEAFFFNNTATTEIYPLSLHDALPICATVARRHQRRGSVTAPPAPLAHARCQDRKSTRLNSSHTVISYAVFCLKQ